MLFWHRRPYLIDHGAALTFHHHWPGARHLRRADRSRPPITSCSPPDRSAAPPPARRLYIEVETYKGVATSEPFYISLYR